MGTPITGTRWDGRPAVVLLVDDQALIGQAVRRMLAGEDDITFHYCQDPVQALATAREVAPTVILQDLVMPGVDGLDLVGQFREDEATREVPMIVLSTREEPETKAEAFARGANDYIVKLPDRLELLARIRHHSKGYISLLQRNEAYRALMESQRVLAREVEEAARYVRSLLPPKIGEGPIRAGWRFIPSAALSGDTFGYHHVDDRHFAFYLIDVVGHGVGAALLSVSVLNAIRSHSLPQVDFRDPGQVLTALNRTFQMAQQGDKYFTAWYGVYDREAGEIRYSGGGHPPALLVAGASAEARMLASPGPMVGAFEDLEYGTETCAVATPARVFLYSDGVFEIARPDGSMWPFHDFVALMARPSEPGISDLDRLIAQIRDLSGQEEFADDVSIVELQI